MNDLPAVRSLLRLLINPGWAPMSVVAMHLILAEYGLTQRFDHLLHSLGGAAISFFLFGTLPLLLWRLGNTGRWVHYLLALAAACTIAVLWEFAEFASDTFMNTSLQQSVSETVLDLIFGIAGAGTTLLMLAAFRRLLGAKRGTATPWRD